MAKGGDALPLFCVLLCAVLQVSQSLSPRGELILERTQGVETSVYCQSFFFNEEVNNLRGWKLPLDCVNFVDKYMKGKYKADFTWAVKSAVDYAANVSTDAKKAWVFDIDDTLLSTFPYQYSSRYGVEIPFNAVAYDAWIDQGICKGLPSLSLFKLLVKNGWSIFLITGRKESQREITVSNLKAEGFNGWTGLTLRTPDDHGTSAITYKTKYRKMIAEQGYTILGSMGDQWTDITYEYVGDRTFKLPNPMYYVK